MNILGNESPRARGSNFTGKAAGNSVIFPNTSSYCYWRDKRTVGIKGSLGESIFLPVLSKLDNGAGYYENSEPEVNT